MNLIGFDFSINKPACCIYSNNNYNFISWPYGFSDKLKELFRGANINLIDRVDNKIKHDNITEKMRFELKNAKYIANLIIDSIYPFLNKNTLIAFEGLSYSSTGKSILQMGGYKYILMNELYSFIPIENMFTYSPITIKSVAGCAKRGMGKSEMINMFIEKGHDCKFKESLSKGEFKNKTGTKWEIHVDDLVDSYWVIQTLKSKENLNISAIVL